MSVLQLHATFVPKSVNNVEYELRRYLWELNPKMSPQAMRQLVENYFKAHPEYKCTVIHGGYRPFARTTLE